MLKHAGLAWEHALEQGLQTAMPPSSSPPGNSSGGSGRPALQRLCSGLAEPSLKDVLSAAVDRWKDDPSQSFYAREVAHCNVRVPGLAVGLTGRMDFLIVTFTAAEIPAPSTPQPTGGRASSSCSEPRVEGEHPWVGRPGRVTLRVIECKASHERQVSHLQQLALYRMVLLAALADASVIGKLGSSAARERTDVELVLAVKGQSGAGAFKPADAPGTAVDVAQAWPALGPEELQPHVNDMQELLRVGGNLSRTLKYPKEVSGFATALFFFLFLYLCALSAFVFAL